MATATKKEKESTNLEEMMAGIGLPKKNKVESGATDGLNITVSNRHRTEKKLEDRYNRVVANDRRNRNRPESNPNAVTLNNKRYNTFDMNPKKIYITCPFWNEDQERESRNIYRVYFKNNRASGQPIAFNYGKELIALEDKKHYKFPGWLIWHIHTHLQRKDQVTREGYSQTEVGFDINSKVNTGISVFSSQYTRPWELIFPEDPNFDFSYGAGYDVYFSYGEPIRIVSF